MQYYLLYEFFIIGRGGCLWPSMLHVCLVRLSLDVWALTSSTRACVLLSSFLNLDWSRDLILSCNALCIAKRNRKIQKPARVAVLVLPHPICLTTAEILWFIDKHLPCVFPWNFLQASSPIFSVSIRKKIVLVFSPQIP